MNYRPVILLSFFVLGGFLFFGFFNFVRGETVDHLLINEVQITGGPGMTKYDFIELYNPTSSTIDLNGYRLVKRTASGVSDTSIKSWTSSVMIGPMDYFLWANSNFLSIATTPNATTSAELADNNGIALRQGDEDTGMIIDSVAWGTASNIFIEGLVFPQNPGANQSIERVNLGSDTNDNSQDFILQTSPTPQHSTYVPPEPPVEENHAPVAIIVGPTTTTVSTTVEFSGADSNDPDGNTITFEWKLNDEIVSSNNRFSHAFNVTGTYQLILTVTDDNNASASSSLEVIVFSPEVPEEQLSQNNDYPKLIINEFLVAPSNGSEWIEIYNPTSSTVALNSWVLFDGVGEITSPTGTILAHGYFVIELSSSKLNNTGGDTVILKNPDLDISDQVSYGNFSDGDLQDNVILPKENNSLARKHDGADSGDNSEDFAETTTLTKGSSNIITAPVIQSPIGGGSTSNQPQNTTKIEEKQQTILKENLSDVKLIINEVFPNPRGSDAENEFIEIKNIGLNSVDLKDWILADASVKFKIKEGTIPPNKFVVFKRSSTKLSLNNTGEETVKLISPGGTMVSEIKYIGDEKEDQSWSRNDKNEWSWTVKLTPNAENVFEIKNNAPEIAVSYHKSFYQGEETEFDASDTIDPEGDDLKFIWDFGDGRLGEGDTVRHLYEKYDRYKVKLTVTDGKNVSEKIFSVIAKKNLDYLNELENEDDDKVGLSSASKKAVKTSAQKAKVVIATTIEQVENLESGDRVKTSGIVAVKPGIFGSQYFYILDEKGNGVQVYMFKKDFPQLMIGDKIEVVGEISEIYGEKRIKISQKADIKKIGENGIFNTQLMEVSEITEGIEGNLIAIQGEITEIKSTHMYVDDGTEEIKVYFKKGARINYKIFKLGDLVKLNGIVNQTKNGYQVLLRSNDDVQVLQDSNWEGKIIDGASAGSNDVTETYLTATAGGLTSILIGLFAKARGRLVWNIIKNVGKFALAVIRRTPKV